MSAEIDQALLRAHVFSRLGSDDRRRLAEWPACDFTIAAKRCSRGRPARELLHGRHRQVKVFKMDSGRKGRDPGDLPAPATRSGPSPPTTASVSGLRRRHRGLAGAARAAAAFFALLEQHPTLVRGLLSVSHIAWPRWRSASPNSPAAGRAAIRAAVSQAGAGAGRPNAAARSFRRPLAAGAGRHDGHDHRDQHPHHEPLGKQRTVITEKGGFLVLNPAELETLALA